MPIRSNRGRSAALRRLWGWPMRSTRHLVAALAGLIVVLAAVGLAGAGWLGGKPQQPPHANAQRSTDTPSATSSTTATSAPSSEVPSSSPTQTSPSPGSPPDTPGRAAHDPRARDTAVAFAKAFAHHPPEMPRQEWVHRLKPHVMPETVGMLGTVDPSMVDVSRVVGPPRMQQAGDSVARVTVPMDTHPLTVRVVQIGGQWQVRSWGGE